MRSPTSYRKTCIFSFSSKARETYEMISNNEFTETFELAPPGKAFVVYSRNHFKRAP